jgi:glycine dehydrogenase
MKTNSDFASRHIGPQGEERREMLNALGYQTLDELIADIVPADIRMQALLDLPAAKSETDALAELRAILRKNKLLKTFIGQGYYGTITPSVILRNVLENPGWYTAYTPYQPEIAQGRLEMLMNFQTMVSSLTGLPVANASLLDEGTAAAEAVSMCRNARPKANTFFVADTCHPQTISVIRTRAAFQGVNIMVGDWTSFDPASIGADLAGVLVQYPDTLGRICDYTDFFSRVHAAGALCVVAADLMALTVIREPGAFGADICIGNTQRFGVPMGFGGPHAAYMSCTDTLKRRMPGRLIGMSIDTRDARPTAWPSKRGNSTSAVTRPPPTSAPPRCFWPCWPPSTPYTTGRKASSASARKSTGKPKACTRRSRKPASPLKTRISLTPCC